MTVDRVRLDRWLWAARFFKTRALASAAVAGGKVQLNGGRAKPAKLVQAGDQLRVRVQLLYDESTEGKAARARLAEAHRLAPSPRYEGKGRPTKKDRRKLELL